MHGLFEQARLYSSLEAARAGGGRVEAVSFARVRSVAILAHAFRQQARSRAMMYSPMQFARTAGKAAAAAELNSTEEVSSPVPLEVLQWQLSDVEAANARLRRQLAVVEREKQIAEESLARATQRIDDLVWSVTELEAKLRGRGSQWQLSEFDDLQRRLDALQDVAAPATPPAPATHTGTTATIAAPRMPPNEIAAIVAPATPHAHVGTGGTEQAIAA